MSAIPRAERSHPAASPRRLAAEYATARVLAESPALKDATPRILEAICQTLGWEHAALWQADLQAGVLRCVEVWHVPGTAFPEVQDLSRRTTFARDVGLPGRVWAGGRPAFIPDVLRDANFPRAAAAAREGLHAAFAFPIMLGPDVLGVMEFFSRQIREPDAELLTMLDTVGSQVGQFIVRRRAEEELDRFFALSLELLCVAGFDGYFTRLNPAWPRTLAVSISRLELVRPDSVSSIRRLSRLRRSGSAKAWPSMSWIENTSSAMPLASVVTRASTTLAPASAKAPASAANSPGWSGV